MTQSHVWASLVAIVGLSIGVAHADTIAFGSKADWEKWVFPVGTLELSGDGLVKPKFVKKNINASLNAGEFVVEREGNKPTKWGGISGVGSNSARAANIFDGEVDTWWAPDPDDDMDTWWIELDLGRLVSATKIALKFSPQGEPFRMFKVYTSTGEEALYSGSGKKEYVVVGQTTQPNFAYELEYPLGQFGTALSTAEEPRQLVGFVLIQVTAPFGDARLGEVEVHTLGDNVVLGTVERGGLAIQASPGGDRRILTNNEVLDGRFDTYWNSSAGFLDWTEKGWVNMNLGALFWVDTIRIVSARVHQGSRVDPLFGYKLFASDGTLGPTAQLGTENVMGSFVWEEVGALDDNSVGFLTFEDTFSPRPVQHIFFSHRNDVRDTGTYGSFKTLEIQAYGEGYIPGVSMTSGLLNLGRSKNMLSIAWETDIPPGTKLEISTRTGDQLGEKLHYFDKKGNELTKERWESLPNFRKELEPVMELVPDPQTWSPWSKPYLHSGARFASPSPRQYLEIRAKLLSTIPDQAVSLDQIVLSFADPLARTLTAEVWPDTAIAAKPQEFKYFIRPSFAAGDLGFDQVLIKTPAQAELIGVKIASDPLALEELSVYSTADSLLIQLPSTIQSAELVEVEFKSQVFLNNTVFEGLVGNSSRKLWQTIDPGDADSETMSDVLVVTVPVQDRLVGDMQIAPAIITPNGDGLNDQMNIDFLIFQIDRAQPITVKVYDLSGRIVREVMAQHGISGAHRAVWDGTNGAGVLVRPGLYICRVEVEASQDAAAIVQTVGVAF